MKTLVVISHPTLAESSLQQFLVSAVEAKDSVCVRHLESVLKDSPTGHFDRTSERQAVKRADRIILQFPMYWYSSPAVMKQWMDEVLDIKWAKQIGSKEVGIVTNMGIKERSYQAGGREQFTLSELLRPFQATVNALGWQYLHAFPIYQFIYLTEKEKQLLLVDYQRYLTQEHFDSFKETEDWFKQELQFVKKNQNQAIDYQQLEEWLVACQDERLELEMHLEGFGD
ncbi:Putative NADPH-quinone reductase (modulator of drug activity B) [Granulicatella balaenopterae]|uniref:Putative NADPH-quinone reductase (Modulator of drug activity B) n=1 Tax=Granulicatella balaenopterae TaxID=137733 RepID=A0A1H9JJE6_9LACT|nr:NAD(P)H-dependent oxidoreductase [Granulicatella balaenopterae]SEQ86919.1 Putative NADPH-quinone reductase (modulator of drug activity B) [Granulicatella balaenopterae]